MLFWQHHHTRVYTAAACIAFTFRSAVLFSSRPCFFFFYSAGLPIHMALFLPPSGGEPDKRGMFEAPSDAGTIMLYLLYCCAVVLASLSPPLLTEAPGCSLADDVFFVGRSGNGAFRASKKGCMVIKRLRQPINEYPPPLPPLPLLPPPPLPPPQNKGYLVVEKPPAIQAHTIDD